MFMILLIDEHLQQELQVCLFIKVNVIKEVQIKGKLI